MEFENAVDRYRNDPQFNNLVHNLAGLMWDDFFSEHDLRDAIDMAKRLNRERYEHERS